MTSLASELNTLQVDTDTLHQALRLHLAERWSQLDPEDMRDELYAHVPDRERIADTLASIATDPEVLETAALVFFSCAWIDDSQRPRVRAALTAAKSKLPVVEVMVLATVSVYGLYLIATGGIKRSETITRRKPDGTFEEHTVVEYAELGSPLNALMGIFRGTPPADHPDNQVNP